MWVDVFGHWLWFGKLDKDGYGKIYGNGAHVYACVRAKGPVPPGLEIDHECEVRSCVNPDHLVARTHRENTLRSLTNPAAINARKMKCDHGHPLDDANTAIDRRGHRRCKSCARESQQRSRARRRQLATDQKRRPKNEKPQMNMELAPLDDPPIRE